MEELSLTYLEQGDVCLVISWLLFLEGPDGVFLGAEVQDEVLSFANRVARPEIYPQRS